MRNYFYSVLALVLLPFCVNGQNEKALPDISGSTGQYAQTMKASSILKPMEESEFDSLYGRVIDCDTLWQSLYSETRDGYYAGTFRNPVETTSGAKFYITQHGVQYAVLQKPNRKARFHSLYIWFTQYSKVMGTAADTFHVNVYKGTPTTPPFNKLGSQAFNADNWIDWTPGVPPDNVLFNPDRNLVLIEDNIEVSGMNLFAVETKTPTSDDYLAFYFNRNYDPGCNDSTDAWRILLSDTLYNPVRWRILSQFSGRDFRLPYIVPVIEYYTPLTGESDFEDVVLESGKLNLLGVDTRQQDALTIKYKTPHVLPMQAKILDLSGRIMWEGKWQSTQNQSESYTIPNLTLANGSYALVLWAGSDAAGLKFNIQR